MMTDAAPDYSRIKRNISRMIEQQAPEADIDAYGASDGVTAAVLQGGAAPAAAQAGSTSGVADFFKSIPRGIVSGITSLPNPSFALSQDEVSADMAGRRAGAEIVKQPMHKPEGRAGRFGEAVGEGLGN